MSLKQKRAKKFKGYLTAGLLVVLTSVALSYPLFLFEQTLPDPSIKSVQDALWFQFVTLTTIGYGDLLAQHSYSKLIVAFNYFSTRGLFLIAAFDASKAFLGKHTNELNNEERFAVISNELKLIHSDLYELKNAHHQAVKEGRRRRNKTHDVTATNPDSLSDIIHSTICKNTHIHCKFHLGELYTSDFELWLTLKNEAIRQGVHSITFREGPTVKLQK